MQLFGMIILIKYYNFDCYLKIINAFEIKRKLLSSDNKISCVDVLTFCFASIYGSLEHRQQEGNRKLTRDTLS